MVADKYSQALLPEPREAARTSNDLGAGISKVKICSGIYDLKRKANSPPLPMHWGSIRIEKVGRIRSEMNANVSLT